MTSLVEFALSTSCSVLMSSNQSETGLSTLACWADHFFYFEMLTTVYCNVFVNKILKIVFCMLLRTSRPILRKMKLALIFFFGVLFLKAYSCICFLLRISFFFNFYSKHSLILFVFALVFVIAVLKTENRLWTRFCIRIPENCYRPITISM